MKPSKKILALLLMLALLLCLLPAAALAAQGEAEALPEELPDAAESLEAQGREEESEALSPEEAGEEALPSEQDEHGHSHDELSFEPEAVSVEAEESYYAKNGELVYNNGGTVFSNGATLYNNGGVVYNNSGLVYNNAGTVYSNGGVVYNNGGKVYSNGAVVYTFGGDVESSLLAGYCRVTLAEDYSAFVALEGLEPEPGAEDSLLMLKDSTLRIAPLEGYTLVEVLAEGAQLTENEDGSVTLSQPEGDRLEISLELQPAAPVFSLEEGTYAEAQRLELSAAEGAQIYYSLDGELPDVDNSLLYEGPITIEQGVTVKALALVEGLTPSPAASAAYAVVSVSAPVFEPVEEGYSTPAAQSVRVENPGAVVARVEALALSGDDADCFILNREGGARIGAGDSNERSWTIRPAGKLPAGSYSAVLTVRFDSGESIELPLQFEVKAVEAESEEAAPAEEEAETEEPAAEAEAEAAA